MVEDELLFAPEEDVSVSETPWTILVVDDDREVHSFTKLALHDFTYERKPLRFLSAYSAKEATEILKQHNATLTTILCTHGHYDHVGSAAALKAESL